MIEITAILLNGVLRKEVHQLPLILDLVRIYFCYSMGLTHKFYLFAKEREKRESFYTYW